MKINNFTLFITLSLVTVFAGCGGSSSFNSSPDTNVTTADTNVTTSDSNSTVTDTNVTTAETNSTATDVNVTTADANTTSSDTNSTSDTNATTITGTVIDAPVKNLNYICSSGKINFTNDNGEYTCNINDNVTFKIGSNVIATTVAQKDPITPYTLFPNNVDEAINLARLFQTLNENNSTSSTTIIININLADKLPNDINFVSKDFDTTIKNAIGKPLIDATKAQNEMDNSLKLVGANIPINPNRMPIANAGVDQNVTISSLVTLDGSLSSDPNSDNLAYKWDIKQKPSSSTAKLSNIHSQIPNFIADINGSYVIELVVNDGLVDSAADSVSVVAKAPNKIPVANAGEDKTAVVKSIVVLDGSQSSDADSDTLTYSWSISIKPNNSVVEIIKNTETFEFKADTAGVYVAQLIVNDSHDDSKNDLALVTLIPNTAPIAKAGADKNVTTGSTVTLDGSLSSDINADSLTYLWNLTIKPTDSNATLSDATLANPTFKADVDGNYTVELIVNDSELNSTTDSVLVISTP